MNFAPRDRHSPRAEWQCKYRGVFCENRRSLKKNGSPHSLCEEHRRRANENQRRSQNRKQDIKNRSRLQVFFSQRRPLQVPTVDAADWSGVSGPRSIPQNAWSDCVAGGQAWHDVSVVYEGSDFTRAANQSHGFESGSKDEDFMLTPIPILDELGTTSPDTSHTDDDVLWFFGLEALFASSE